VCPNSEKTAGPPFQLAFPSHSLLINIIPFPLMKYAG